MDSDISGCVRGCVLGIWRRRNAQVRRRDRPSPAAALRHLLIQDGERAGKVSGPGEHRVLPVRVCMCVLVGIFHPDLPMRSVSMPLTLCDRGKQWRTFPTSR